MYQFSLWLNYFDFIEEHRGVSLGSRELGLGWAEWPEEATEDSTVKTAETGEERFVTNLVSSSKMSD